LKTRLDTADRTRADHENKLRHSKSRLDKLESILQEQAKVLRPKPDFDTKTRLDIVDKAISDQSKHLIKLEKALSD
jgi:predicted rRNA methylase YqxC with S4 and FtsJ domains